MLTPSLVLAYWMRGSVAGLFYAIGPIPVSGNPRAHLVDWRLVARYRELGSPGRQIGGKRAVPWVIG